MAHGQPQYAALVTPGTTYYACGQFDLDAGGGYNDYYFDQSIGLGSHGNESNYPLFEVSLVPDYGVEYSIYVSYACDPAVTSCTDVFENVGYSSWTAPTGVTSADVACWGPGGGGGVISATGGAGGGGGAFASSTVVVTPGNSYTIFVGTGGAADNAASTSNSSFATTTVSADGGKGASATVDTTFGHGGYVSGSIGTLVYAGGDGGTGLTTDDFGEVAVVRAGRMEREELARTPAQRSVGMAVREMQDQAARAASMSAAAQAARVGSTTTVVVGLRAAEIRFLAGMALSMAAEVVVVKRAAVSAAMVSVR